MFLFAPIDHALSLIHIFIPNAQEKIDPSKQGIPVVPHPVYLNTEDNGRKVRLHQHGLPPLCPRNLQWHQR